MNGAIMITHIYLFDFKVFFMALPADFLCWMCGLYTNLGVTILSFVVRKDQHLGRECMVNKANKEKDVKIRLAFERWQRRVSRQGKEYSQFRQQKKSQKKKIIP